MRAVFSDGVSGRPVKAEQYYWNFNGSNGVSLVTPAHVEDNNSFGHTIDNASISFTESSSTLQQQWDGLYIRCSQLNIQSPY